jgi:hypothetical protein
MVYDASYQNEQSCSRSFGAHLGKVAEIAVASAGPGGSVIEIGCGKGAFVELLRDRGIEKISAFDPSYEGDDPAITADYFGPGSISSHADLVVLRHTLEHIHRPLDFLHMIARANGSRGRIMIEVPQFDWIVQNNAFWDLYNEHCNYFTRATLCAIFAKCEWYDLFGHQYQAVVADFSDLLRRPNIAAPVLFDGFPDVRWHYASLLEGKENIFVWGASSKGVIFCNHMDRAGGRIRGLVDINSVKQGRHIAVTAHAIFAPSHLWGLKREKLTIVVANPNYMREIEEYVASLSPELLSL